MTTYSGYLFGQTGTDGTTATGVAANYLKMTPTNTYGDGAYYSNLGTRQLALLKINKSTSGTSSDMTKGADGASGAFTDANSLLSRVIRALQAHAEVFYVGEPDASNVLVLVAQDTMDAGDTGSTQNTQAAAGFGKIEADVAAAVNTGSTSGTAFTATLSGTATNRNFFVGASLGTFASTYA